MALSEQQLEMLRNADWVNKDLLSAYEKGGVGFTEQEKTAVAANQPSPARVQQIASRPQAQQQVATPAGNTQSVDRMTDFSVALNEAIHEARKQRQDVSMDFINGVVPVGALPATSFASVLSAFNSSAAPIEASLMDRALGDRENQQKQLEDTRNNIRDLALQVGAAGAGQDTVNAIMALIESGDIDGAIRIAAPALEKKGVTAGGGGSGSGSGGSTSFKDKDGNTVWEMKAGAQAFGYGTDGKGFIWSDPVDFKTANTADLEKGMKSLLGDNFVLVHRVLSNNTQRKEFMADYWEAMAAGGDFLDPVEYLKIWERLRGITLSWPKEPKEASAPETVDRYDSVY